MEDIEKLVNDCQNSQGFFFKYISANDTGQTGAHQAGFYMPRDVWPLFFTEPGRKGENRDCNIIIRWSNSSETNSRFIWYGQGTRSEYRLTKGITFLEDENTGDVLVLIKQDTQFFKAYLLHLEDEIESFFSAFNLSPTDAYKLHYPEEIPQVSINAIFDQWIKSLAVDFPESKIVSDKAREISNQTITVKNKKDYDKILLNWVDTEYAIFRHIENDRYRHYIEKPFQSVEELITTANTILNRRKSRAGHSLENHLSYIFDENQIPYSSQAVTEQNKKPDFIFPDIKLYQKIIFPGNEMTFLAAKTTCKDRWRQIVSEADKIETKYLFTLQQGISKRQFEEMDSCKVKLVVPEQYKKDYPNEYIHKIMNLNTYIELLKSKHK